jgi:hypothetical protein
MSRITKFFCQVFTCGIILCALSVAIAADPPNPFTKAADGNNNNGKGGANNKAPDPKTVEMFRTPLNAWFKKYAIKDESAGKLYMGYYQAAKAFGYSRPFDPDAATKRKEAAEKMEIARKEAAEKSAALKAAKGETTADDAKKDDPKKDDPKKDDAKKDDAKKDDAKKDDPKKDEINKDEKPHPNRLDVQFIDGLDTDNDMKVDEDEFNKWADAYATKEAQLYDAEVAAMRAKAGQGLTQQQKNQLMRQEQQLMRQQQQKMQQIEQQLQRFVQQQRQQQQAMARKR